MLSPSWILPQRVTIEVAARKIVLQWSWLCENAEAGSLTGLDCSATELREVCENIFPISSPTQPDAAPSIVRPRGPATKAKVRAHHALTTAIIGLMPTMLSTRVKL